MYASLAEHLFLPVDSLGFTFLCNCGKKTIVIAIRGFKIIHESSDCPYEDWASVARASCGILELFHYLREEYGKIGWVCNVPIWVEKGM